MKTVKNSNINGTLENVLILQGGGSLGAFGCGVFKALVNNNVKTDIIAGTSIGGINAAIIAGSREGDHPEIALENFWLELAESSVPLSSIAEVMATYSMPLKNSTESSSTQHDLQFKSMLSSLSSAIYGNDKLFLPRWRPDYAITDPEYFRPNKWTYLYDHSPLIETLDKYIDYDKLQPAGKPYARLIITAVNILTAEPLIFDSAKQPIKPRHLLATSGYPSYNFPWAKVEEGIFAWDGSLLSNTPLREVIEASPKNDKRVFLVENYPKNSLKLPENLAEVHHRVRDIMFSDKTLHNVKMSKVITYYLKFIDELYDIVDKHLDTKKIRKEELDKLRQKYKRITKDHGAEIKSISYISRDEPFPYIYENADFSIDTIKASIREGELKANIALEGLKLRKGK